MRKHEKNQNLKKTVANKTTSGREYANECIPTNYYKQSFSYTRENYTQFLLFFFNGRCVVTRLGRDKLIYNINMINLKIFIHTKRRLCD